MTKKDFSKIGSYLPKAKVPDDADYTRYLVIGSGGYSIRETQIEALINCVLVRGPGDFMIWACTEGTNVSQEYEILNPIDAPIPAFIGHVHVNQELAIAVHDPIEELAQLQIEREPYLSMGSPEEIKSILQNKIDDANGATQEED